MADSLNNKPKKDASSLNTNELHDSWIPKMNISNEKDGFRWYEDYVPDAVFELDIDGNILYISDSGLSLINRSHQEVVDGVNINEILPNFCSTMLANLHNKKSEEVIHNKYVFPTQEGEKIMLTQTKGVYLDGTLTGFIGGIIGDISIRQQMNRKQSFMKSLFESSPVAMAITDKDDNVIDINARFSELFMYTIDEIYGRPIADCIVPRPYKDDSSRPFSIADEQKGVVRHLICADKEKHEIHVSFKHSPIVVDGSIMAYLSVCIDISNEYRRESVNNMMYNISYDALRVYDIKKLFSTIIKELKLTWNEHDFFITLYKKDDDSFSSPYSSDTTSKFYESNKHILSCDKSILKWALTQNRPMIMSRADSNILINNKVVDPFDVPESMMISKLEADGTVLGVLCVFNHTQKNCFYRDSLQTFEDITRHLSIVISRRLMLDSHSDARRIAEEASKTKQSFLSTMSHEIRTLLNEVIGLCDILLHDNPRQDQKESLNSLHFSSNHLLALINDVLDYSKIESGKLVLSNSPFNVRRFLNEVNHIYSSKANTKNLFFEIEINDNVPENIVGDQIRLNQVLSNLLSNAFKFTEQGGISLSVAELNRHDNFSELEFSVQDTGIGIPQANIPTIFDNYAQVSSSISGKYASTGLGLPICKSIVELQGGTINLESTFGKGSTFSFILKYPIADSIKEESVVEKEEKESAGLNGIRVLYVEDNKINFIVANRFLVNWGIVVSHVENGQEAVDKVKEEEFDIILMDLQMPVMNGFEATKIIKASPEKRIRELPIIALTAATKDSFHQTDQDVVFEDYIMKPFRPDVLMNTLLKHSKR